MNEVKLIDLQEFKLPAWLPQPFVEALADAIEKTAFAPPILILDDELLSPDVVAALVILKKRGGAVPVGIAVMDGRWLAKVDRRETKVITETKYLPGWVSPITIHPQRWDYPRVTYITTSGNTSSGQIGNGASYSVVPEQ